MRMIEMTPKELSAMYDDLKEQYGKLCQANVSLDMSRGKPGPAQLDLCERVLSTIGQTADCFDAQGLDCRNYGVVDGIPAAKELFSQIMDVRPEQVIVGGNSSLNMMYDTIARAFSFGFFNSERPWHKEEKVKFLCPAPGYDRHFAICELFGIEMIAIDMLPDGPDMDAVERYVAEDKSVKGIWCTPKYSNPQGITYSDAVVARFAALQPAAPDFRIFWDNAYAVHDLYDDGESLTSLMAECEKRGSEDMVFIYTSTSKISFPGSGVAAMAASQKNLDFIRRQLSIQTIGPDKLNQLRHIKAFGDKAGVMEYMKRHAAVLRPKFEAALQILEEQLATLDIAQWSRPRGGYFISFDAPEGCAGRIYELCRQAGLVLTTVGATFPYGKDIKDQNLRLAPSYPSVEELRQAMQVFCVCVKMAAIEKLLNNRG